MLRVLNHAVVRFGAIGAMALLCTACAMRASPENALNETTQRRERISRLHAQFVPFVQALNSTPGSPAGFVIVALDRQGIVLEQAYGTRDIRNRAPLTLDTPIYNASVTKAYTGLLAAVLDEDGTLPLDSTLKHVWPQIELPHGLNAQTITAEQLLSHNMGFEAGGLIYRSNITGEAPANEVPVHLSRFAKPRPSGFVYSNTGPFVYSAMVESHTGTPWAEALTDKVLRPMGLRRTIARLEDAPVEEIAHCHVRRAGAWHALAHKPTALMNAAGGMYASGRDSARFLQAFLSNGASTQGRFSAAALQRTWRPAVARTQEFFGFQRDAYGLGWDLGSYDGLRFVSRSGGYTGCRTLIMFLPDANFAVVALSVSDTGANLLNSILIRQAIDIWTNVPHAAQRATERTQEYQSALGEALAAADAAAQFDRTPLDQSLAKTIAGTFRHERLGDLRIMRDRNAVKLHAGIWRGTLYAKQGDDLLLVEDDSQLAEPFRVFRDTQGAVIAVMLDDDRFERTD